MSRPLCLTEVICDHPEHGAAAFGMTFTDEAVAHQFARHMRRLGYAADISPDFYTEPDLRTALQSANSYFQDPRITEELKSDRL